jgi:ketosteroid isomerase-like protein
MIIACIALFITSTNFAVAQKNKKKSKDAADASKSASIVTMTDEQQVDYQISSMLGAWQIGNADLLHQSYADDVTVVSGSWAPPIIGWTNYLPLYRQQMATMNHLRLDRSNTLIKVAGTVAWACYQWDFAAEVNGAPSKAQGQTTLVLEKRDDKWLIVHNHTSLVQSAQPTTPATNQKDATPAAPSSKPL